MISGAPPVPEGASSPGALIRYWRNARGLSQMALALEVDVSPRHMSFVETGRSRASRNLLLRIARHLQVPQREQNALLESAGYAREHRQSALSDPDLRQVMDVLRFVLDRHEPYGALVFDRHWNIVMSNRAHRVARDLFLGPDGASPDIRDNLLRLTFHPSALRPHIANWDVVGPTLLARVEREVSEAPTDHVLAGLLDEVRSYGPIPPLMSPERVPAGVLLPVHLRKDALDVRVFTLLSTIGTPMDVTLGELRVETFFPADSASAEALGSLAT